MGFIIMLYGVANYLELLFSFIIDQYSFLGNVNFSREDFTD